MFNFGIFLKTARDSFWSTLLSTIGLIGFVILFVWAMLTMGTELLTFVSNFPFLQRIFEMSLGIRVDGEVSINILFAVCFTHLAVFCLTWGVLIATATRVTVGEIERGTADLLLTLPVDRREVFCTTSSVWIGAAAILSFVPLLGIAIGMQLFDVQEPVSLSSFIPAAINFFALNLAVGGIATATGCLLQRRSVAVGVVVAIIFVSVVLNFLVPFFEMPGDPTKALEEGAGDKNPISRLQFLSLLSYYRPVDIVRQNSWPVAHCTILITIAVISWLVGIITYCRKDIPTA